MMIMAQAKAVQSEEKAKYIDASNCIAGRLCSHVAKMLLKGNKVYVFNAAEAVISGNPNFVQKDFLHERRKGDPYHGPFFPRESDRILKRMVRGMLPKKPRGVEAFKNLKVFKSVPSEYKEKKLETVESAANKLKCKYVKLGDIASLLGAK